MEMFHLLKIRSSIDIFKNVKCKVTFGLKYITLFFETVYNSFEKIREIKVSNEFLLTNKIPIEFWIRKGKKNAKIRI